MKNLIKRILKEEILDENPGGLDIPINIYKGLERLIKDLLEKYEGGRPFFDALDDKIKDVTNVNMILELTKGLENEYIASSGGFGNGVYNLYKDGKIKCKGMIIFNGKIMTDRKGVESYYPQEFDPKEKEFVYIDDSYFSGRTVRTINDWFKNYNSSIKQVAVIYDGSKEKSNFVKSFYRYYS